MNRVMTTLAGAALILALAPVAQAQEEGTTTTTGADGWTATVLPQTVGTTMATGVTVGPSSMVAVGQRACAQGRRETSRCWGPAWTSPDGITWEAVDRPMGGQGRVGPPARRRSDGMSGAG